MNKKYKRKKSQSFGAGGPEKKAGSRLALFCCLVFLAQIFFSSAVFSADYENCMNSCAVFFSSSEKCHVFCRDWQNKPGALKRPRPADQAGAPQGSASVMERPDKASHCDQIFEAHASCLKDHYDFDDFERRETAQTAGIGRFIGPFLRQSAAARRSSCVSSCLSSSGSLYDAGEVSLGGLTNIVNNICLMPHLKRVFLSSIQTNALCESELSGGLESFLDCKIGFLQENICRRWRPARPFSN